MGGRGTFSVGNNVLHVYETIRKTSDSVRVL